MEQFHGTTIVSVRRQGADGRWNTRATFPATVVAKARAERVPSGDGRGARRAGPGVEDAQVVVAGGVERVPVVAYRQGGHVRVMKMNL